VRNAGMGILVPGMLFGSIVVGSGLGYFLDRWLHTAPWLLLAGLVLGSVAGVREMLKLLKKLNEKDS